MNVNELAAAQAYGAIQQGPANVNKIQEMGQRFLEIFDQADTAVAGFATQNVDAQTVVEALSQAELALQTTITIRDRIVSAYQEVLRMPI